MVIKRTLAVIYNPNRYRSKAAEAFSREILPRFANPEWDASFDLYAMANNGKERPDLKDKSELKEKSEANSPSPAHPPMNPRAQSNPKTKSQTN